VNSVSRVLLQFRAGQVDHSLKRLFTDIRDQELALSGMITGVDSPTDLVMLTDESCIRRNTKAGRWSSWYRMSEAAEPPDRESDWIFF
jgi:hypothetical protein